MSRIQPHNRAGRDRERGATVVEFTILASLFLLIVFGLIEFGIIFYQKHFVASAAREGVRYGVVANNFDCFTDNGSCEYPRRDAVYNHVTLYLDAIYDADDLALFEPESIIRDPDEDAAAETRTLSVTVTARNFMPELLLGFVPGYDAPDYFNSTATGEYEDSSEL